MIAGVYTREDENRDRAQARIVAMLARLARPPYRAISDPRDTSLDPRCWPTSSAAPSHGWRRTANSPMRTTPRPLN